MPNQKWKSYEDVARHLLNQMATSFGLERVEDAQTVTGLRSETRYRIDAKGVRIGTEAFVVIECRRHTTSKQKQEHLAALAYRILDTGAAGGIIVSPLGLQEGALKIASAENVISVQLAENSTTADYLLAFLNHVCVGKTEHLQVTDHAIAVLRDVNTGQDHRTDSR